MVSYKKIYENYYHVVWDSQKFHIHHIDRNRENNNPENLLLLPKILHHKYHFYLNKISYQLPKTTNELLNVDYYDIYQSKNLSDFFTLKSDMVEFLLFRNNLEYLLNPQGGFYTSKENDNNFENLIFQSPIKKIYEKYKE